MATRISYAEAYELIAGEPIVYIEIDPGEYCDPTVVAVYPTTTGAWLLIVDVPADSTYYLYDRLEDALDDADTTVDTLISTYSREEQDALDAAHTAGEISDGEYLTRLRAIETRWTRKYEEARAEFRAVPYRLLSRGLVRELHILAWNTQGGNGAAALKIYRARNGKGWRARVEWGIYRTPCFDWLAEPPEYYDVELMNTYRECPRDTREDTVVIAEDGTIAIGAPFDRWKITEAETAQKR